MQGCFILQKIDIKFKRFLRDYFCYDTTCRALVLNSHHNLNQRS
nr:MAG TPA: hypothetical protein [Caudoviricetes sp.]